MSAPSTTHAPGGHSFGGLGAEPPSASANEDADHPDVVATDVPRTVLIVDDESSVRSAIQRALRREGWRVLVAASADEGLRVLAEATPPPQVVLSDFRMPGRDGLQFLGDVRRDFPRVQRVLLTGFADIAALERAVNESEIFRYLSKPWDDSVLVTTLRSAYEEWLVREENERLLSLTREQNMRLGELNRQLEAKVEERTAQLGQAKRDWEATFDAIVNPVAIIDVDYGVRRSNLAYASHGSVEVTHVPGRRCHELFAGRDTPCEGCPVESVRISGRSAMAEVRDEPRDRVFQVLAYPIHGGAERGEEISQVVCHYRDVTEEKELQQRLLQAEKLSGIGQLAGGVAHEINNPLAGILAFTQLLMREIPKEGTHGSFLKEIEDSALRCKKIVESLLKFARRSAGTEREAVELNEVLRSTMFLVEHQYQLKNVTIDRELSQELWPVRANGNQLSQVALNLLTNAYGAMPEGGRILVKTENEPERGRVRLSVRDSGRGIPKRNLAKIFEPFFTTKSDGTGLGLTVTFDIVAAHGGEISVVSEEGQGAEFIVSLPAHPQVGRGVESPAE